MKYKFLILVDDHYYLEGEFTKEISEQINWIDNEPTMYTIECHHPVFNDNVVEIPDYTGRCHYSFVRDIKGDLHYYVTALSRQDIIKMFE
jgi:hypothetical protein